MDHETVNHRAFDPEQEPVKLQLAEQLAIAGGLLVADLQLDVDRLEQDRLRQPDVIAIDQPLSVEPLVKREQPVLVAEVGEHGGGNLFRSELQLLGDGLEHGLATERSAGLARRPERLPLLGRPRENLLAERLGRHVGHDLELGPILDDLGQAPVSQGRQPFADQFVNLGLDLAAGSSHAFAKDQQQALGDLEPLRIVTLQVKRDHPLLRESDADQGAGEHQSARSC